MSLTKNLKPIFTSVSLLICVAGFSANQQTFVSSKSSIVLSARQTVKYMIFKNGAKKDTIPFFDSSNKNAGPSFYAVDQGKETVGQWKPDGYGSLISQINGVECVMDIQFVKGNPALHVTMTNRSHVVFQPQKAGLKLGIDTYMDKYPQWFDKYFPTLMRNEKTHFYGYLQNPKGQVLALVSDDPIASWSVDYNLGYQDPAPYWFMGHRIESLNLDLLNALPLPEHNPQNLYQLLPGQSKQWTIEMLHFNHLDNLETKIAATSDIPLLRFDQTSCVPGDSILFEVYNFVKGATVSLSNDKGSNLPIKLIKNKGGVLTAKICLPKVGLYHVCARSNHKTAEGIVSARHTWAWDLEKAREAALIYHQKPTSHGESYYGFYSGFLAEKYFPNAKLDKQLSARFDMIYDKLHEKDGVTPSNTVFRIQNTSTFIGELVDKYEAEKNIEDLKSASRLGDWLMKNYQRQSDGAYYNGTVYTSVIYIAKSMLELAEEEKAVAVSDPTWGAAAARHYDSAKRAIDQLVNAHGDFQTEGQMTFEDGMVSCSALQIGMLGVLQKNAADRKKYTSELLDLLKSHDCLTQLKVPDARRRQGTMRFWEAQYDVEMLPNLFNSPHGWSAWRTYATYYAYLLTGDEKWLIQTFNAMGAFANLIDYKTGQLRWAFVVDPYLPVEQACSADTHYSFDDVSLGNPHPKLYDTRKFVIGEQYVNMISDWQTVNSQDNDVHEVFKCMGETVLNNAFVVERQDGTLKGYNCRLKKVKDNEYKVVSDEKQICYLHANVNHAVKLSFKGKTYEVKDHFLGWLNKSVD